LALLALNDICVSLLAEIVNTSRKPPDLDEKALFREHLRRRSSLFPELEFLRALLLTWIEVLDEEIERPGS
jgi:hypothetical protein